MDADVYYQDEQFDAAMRQAAEHAERQNAEYVAKWPNYCRACGGWGGKTYTENHGLPGPGEDIFDACGALPETQCHRCGEHGLDEDGEGPCKACGWNAGEDGIIDPFG